MKPIGVIGGGLAGLSAACVLAARGRKVILFERNDWLGGKAAQLRGGGFRFDMGPTIVTIPSVLRRIFCEAGARMEDYLELVRLDPQWRCFFDDGSTLDLAQNPDAMAQTLDAFAPGTNSGRRYRDFIDYSERLDGISQRHFFYKPIGGIRDMFEWKASFDPKMLGDVLAMRMGRSVAGTVRAFTPDPRVAQMIDHFTQYVGSSPYGSPAVLCGIAHMQTEEGVWYPMGGTRAVPEALVKLRYGIGRRVSHRREDREDPLPRRRGHRRSHGLRGRDRAERGGLELRLRPHASRTHSEERSASASSGGAHTSRHAPAWSSISA